MNLYEKITKEALLTESELDWTDLDGATQTAVEKASDEIRSRKITDEEEIEDIVRNWCNEIGYANEYELPEYSEGYMTEPDTNVAIKYVKQKMLKEFEKDDSIGVDEFTCPKCGETVKEYPALSRRDNKTEICSNCATSEAMEDYEKYRQKEDLTEEEKEFLSEAANPENAEANALIKQALSDGRFAVENKDKLKELGITVESKDWSLSGGLMNVSLIGPNGRRLFANTSRWDNSLPNARGLYNTYDNRIPKEDRTLETKSYKKSKDSISQAKEDVRILKKRLRLYATRYGIDSTEYKKAKLDFDTAKSKIDRGIVPSRDDLRKANEDIDFKNYLDKPAYDESKEIQDNLVISDRNKVSNRSVKNYKDSKQELEYAKRIEEENKQRDARDEQRVADIIQRNKEEKEERDTRTAKIKQVYQDELDAIRSRIATFKEKQRSTK